MAVSGLEQRNAPLILTSKVWSPWGPFLVQPYDEEDQVEEILPTNHEMVKRQPRKMVRSKSWGGYMGYATEAYLADSWPAPGGASPCRRHSCAADRGVAENAHHHPHENLSDSDSLENEQCSRAGSCTRPYSPCTSATMCETASLESLSQHGDFQASDSDLDQLLVEASPQLHYYAVQGYCTNFALCHAPPGNFDAPPGNFDAKGPPQLFVNPLADTASAKRLRPRRRNTALVQQAAPTSSVTTFGEHIAPRSGAPSAPQDIVTKDPNAAIDMLNMDKITTLVIRNLPRSLTQQELVQTMGDTGYAGTWDFCYLPYKFQVRRNFGFAFVNFVSPDLAQKFMQGWQQTRPFTFGWVRKPVNITVAEVQGREANEQKARLLMGKVKNPAYQPVLL